MSVLQVEGAVLAALAGSVGSSAEELRGAEQAVPGQVELSLSGAGQFAGALAEGALTFQLSWVAALGMFATSGEAVGSLAGQTDVVMASTDQQLAATTAQGPR